MTKLYFIGRWIKQAFNFKENKLAWINILMIALILLITMFAISAGQTFYQGNSSKYASSLISAKDQSRKTEATKSAIKDNKLTADQKYDFTTESVQRIALNKTMQQELENVALDKNDAKPTGIYFASGALNVYIEDQLPSVLGYQDFIKIGSDIQDGVFYINGASNDQEKQNIKDAINRIYDYSIAKTAYGNKLQFNFN